MFTVYAFVRSLKTACVVLLVAAPLAAQPATTAAGADLARMQNDLASLREEVAALRAALVEVRQALGAPTPPAPTTPAARTAGAAAPLAQVTPETLDVLKSQIEEQAQVKVESTSRMPVKISGTILVNTFVNSGEVNWLENPISVTNPSTDGGARGSMSATARQSRIGFETSGISVGNWQAGGTLIADFYGGVPGFPTGTAMGLPRLIYAFGRLETDRTAIEIGQDHAILAPRDPTSLAALSFPLLFRSGNLYLRVPQARVERKLRDDLSITAGMVAPIAGDAGGTYEFAPTAGAGEHSMRPAFEGRLAFGRGTSETPREFAVGISGHYGWKRTPTSQTSARAVALDFNVRAGRLAASGEYFSADNAEAFGGGITQPGRASGGWAEGRFAATRIATLVGGFGRDRPADALGRVTRQDNRTLFGSTIVQLTPEIAASLEYRWMETELGLVPVTRRNHHVNAVFAVKF